MKDDQILVFHPGDTIKVKDGHYAEVVFKKIETTKDDVLQQLIELDRHQAKVGDILELQILAKACVEDE